MENFEKEYRKMIQEEMPDLWNRIEAGLPEKKKKTRTGKVLRYSGLAAACLCGVILIPAMMFLLTGNKSEQTDRAAGESAAENMAAVEESAEEGMAAVEESAAESVAAVEESAEEGMAAVGESAAESMAVVEKSAEENTGGTGIHAGAAEDEAEILLSDGTVIEKIQVKILGKSQMKYHSVYRAEVEKDGSGSLRQGQEIRFIAADGAEGDMETGEAYTVSLIYNAGAEIPFSLQ